MEESLSWLLRKMILSCRISLSFSTSMDTLAFLDSAHCLSSLEGDEIDKKIITFRASSGLLCGAVPEKIGGFSSSFSCCSKFRG